MDSLKIAAIVFQCVNLILWCILFKIAFFGKSIDPAALPAWLGLSVLIVFTFLEMDKNNYRMLHLSLIPTYFCILGWLNNHFNH